MLRVTAWSLAAALALGCGASPPPTEPAEPSSPPPEASGDEPDVPENLVRLYLLAGATALAPGQEVTVAARLDIAPGWHIYWKNPGEAGLATEVALTAPEGFDVGAVRYPGPTRFEAGGGVVSYGYADLVLLSAPVVAPESLEAGQKVELTASASWLACREMCVQGSARAALSLPVASAEHPSAPAHQDMLARHVAALPRPFAELEEGHLEVGAEHPSLTITAPGAEAAEYFPGPGEQLAYAGQAAVPGQDVVKLVVSYREGVKWAEKASGVLALGRGDARRYYQIQQPLEVRP